MHKIWLAQLMLLLLLTCSLTACGQPNVGEEQKGSVNADNTENTDISNDEQSEEDILAACEGTMITQTIENSAGSVISIDAQVDVDGISRVSRYRYVPQVYTEEFRKSLLKKEFPAETWDVNEAAVYNEEKSAWEFMTPREEHWMYRVSDAFPPGEQVWTYERVDIELDYTEDCLVTHMPTETVFVVEYEKFMEITANGTPAEIAQFGQYIIAEGAETDNYSCSYIHICETEGGRPYVRAVYKQNLDGMPVTVWHNFSTATTDVSPFPVKAWGAFFTAEEIGLYKPILSVEEAVTAMQEQIDSVQIEEAQIYVKKITLEYLSVLSAEGEAEIVPVWRFWPEENDEERSVMCERILAINAVSGELIWEKRGAFTE
ncbi:MAG: hypothetical protein K2J60_01260 [Acetatifactor sp.]|nr:hypothetical protein [Acetatifactor sp.]